MVAYKKPQHRMANMFIQCLNFSMVNFSIKLFLVNFLYILYMMYLLHISPMVN